MTSILVIIVLISLTFSLSHSAIQTVNGKIKIKVVTTSACEDTADFIAELVSVYDEYKQFLEVEFVPWGRTTVESGTLKCQFGESGCWNNRLQRCALNLLKDNQHAQVKYMECEFAKTSEEFYQETFRCALDVGLSLNDIEYCMTTTGDLLEGPAQEASFEPMQVIDFVPSIVFNDVVDVDNHVKALETLRNLICVALAEDFTTGVDINSC